MIESRLVKGISGAVAVLLLPLLTSCTHYYLDRNRDDDDRGDGGVEGLEGLERVVEYGERPPIEKMACVDDTEFKMPLSPGYAPNERDQELVETTLNAMTLSDKIIEIGGTEPQGGSNYSDIFRQPDNTNVGIRGLQFRDGPRGLNLAAELQVGHDGYATAFPVSMARVNSPFEGWPVNQQTALQAWSEVLAKAFG